MSRWIENNDDIDPVTTAPHFDEGRGKASHSELTNHKLLVDLVSATNEIKERLLAVEKKCSAVDEMKEDVNIMKGDLGALCHQILQPGADYEDIFCKCSFCKY